MRHFFIGLGILAVAFAVQVQPSAAAPERAVIGDDDLPNGAPVQPSAAQANNKRVCIQGPMHATPQCRYDTIAECRADCRRKRSNREVMGARPGGRSGWIQCMLNPALQKQRARPASLKVYLVAREPHAPLCAPM